MTPSRFKKKLESRVVKELYWDSGLTDEVKGYQLENFESSKLIAS